jgi:hypothetical protein
LELAIRLEANILCEPEIKIKKYFVRQAKKEAGETKGG